MNKLAFVKSLHATAHGIETRRLPPSEIKRIPGRNQESFIKTSAQAQSGTAEPV